MPAGFPEAREEEQVVFRVGGGKVLWCREREKREKEEWNEMVVVIEVVVVVVSRRIHGRETGDRIGFGNGN